MTGLFEASRVCLALADPAAKCAAVRRLADSALQGGRVHEGQTAVEPIGPPGRPLLPQLVEPSRVPRRRLGSEEGRAALVHAVAHIEFNAINSGKGPYLTATQ